MCVCVCVLMSLYHMMSSFGVNMHTLTLGATVADRGHFLERDFSRWLFSQSPPGQVTQLKIEIKRHLLSKNYSWT